MRAEELNYSVPSEGIQQVEEASDTQFQSGRKISHVSVQLDQGAELEHK